MRHLPTAALLAIGLTLGACGPINRGLESVNQPVVARSDYAFDVNAVGLAGDRSAEAQRLAAWFDAIGLGYGDRVSIDESASYGGSSRETVSAVAARYGILVADQAPITSGAIAPGAVRVVVSRSTANVPNCPNWQRASHPEFSSSTMSNYGCATNSNMAAMVANPQDLVRGAAGTLNDARTTSKAIKTYRDAEPTGKGGLKNESTGGK